MVLVTFAETQFCSRQNWARFSAPAGPKPGMASVKSHPGWSLLRIHAPATLARPCAAQGSRSNPQLAIEIARNAREPFKSWIPAFAGMTTWLGAAFAGMTKRKSRLSAAFVTPLPHPLPLGEREKLTHPYSRIPKHPHPPPILAPFIRAPGVGDGAEHALEVRHEDGEAPVGRGEAADAVRRAVRVVRIGRREIAAVVHKTQRHLLVENDLLNMRRIAELGAAFAVRHRDGQQRSLHVLQQDRGILRDLHHGHARLELLRGIAHEMRPAFGAGDDLVQVRHHLAAVADAERESVGAREKRRELIARP